MSKCFHCTEGEAKIPRNQVAGLECYLSTTTPDPAVFHSCASQILALKEAIFLHRTMKAPGAAPGCGVK